MNAADVLGDVEVFLDRFLHFESPHQRVACVLWIAETHVWDSFDTAPYLHIRSPEKRSGKTLALDLFELLARDAIATASISPAALYRLMEERHPTLLVDEVDTVFSGSKRGASSQQEALRSLLNVAYRRGKPALRMGGPRMQTLESFDVFGPKALAGIGDLPDTVADRCIPIRLERKPRSVVKERFRLRVVQDAARAVRDGLAAVFDGVDLSGAWPALPDELNDRARDVWEPLLAVADFAGEGWPERARVAAVALHADADDLAETVGTMLLADLRDVWGADEVAVPTVTLLGRLHELEERPWGDWYGRPIDARFLSKRLEAYRVKSTKVKVDGKSLRGYRRDRLYPVWDRYLRETPGTSGISGTSVTSQRVSLRNPNGTSTELLPQVPEPQRLAEPRNPLGHREGSGGSVSSGQLAGPEAVNAAQRTLLDRCGGDQRAARDLWKATIEEQRIGDAAEITRAELDRVVEVLSLNGRSD